MIASPLQLRGTSERALPIGMQSYLPIGKASIARIGSNERIKAG
jgi:hypothetical protein